MVADNHHKLKTLTMLRSFLAIHLIIICFFVLYLTYYKGFFYHKINYDRVNWIRKSNSATQKQGNKSIDLIQNGIFWSSYAEALVPKGIIFSSWCLSNY